MVDFYQQTFCFQKNISRTSGNLRGGFPEVSDGFPDNPSLTDHTVFKYFCFSYLQVQYKTMILSRIFICSLVFYQVLATEVDLEPWGEVTVSISKF